MKNWIQYFVAVVTGIVANATYGQPFLTGSISDDFTLIDRRTKEEVSLRDFAGKVIVLDFFAYWCAPCAFSSPDIEENIQKFYHERNGTPSGIPVQVLAINVESGDPASTDEFVERTNLNLVIDDPNAVAWGFYNETNGIPLFVVINGVANSPSHQQWEVLHNAPSYPGAAFLRQVIDSVVAPVLPPNPFDGAVDLGSGWRWVSWFGSLNTFHFPWVFHESHGWMYFGNGDLNSGMFLHDEGVGWVWLSPDVYPNIYSFDRGSWLTYLSGAGAQREFVDRSTGERFEVLR